MLVLNETHLNFMEAASNQAGGLVYKIYEGTLWINQQIYTNSADLFQAEAFLSLTVGLTLAYRVFYKGLDGWP